MFKVIILLNCDECGVSFFKAHVCTQKETDVHTEKETARVVQMLELEMRHLTQSSRQSGWRGIHSYSICPECIQVDLAMSDYLEEEYWDQRS
jgi:hypothetical protein